MCVKPCMNTQSITKNSFFEKFDIPFFKILICLYKYINGEEIEVIAREVEISRKTVGELFNYLREIIAVSLDTEQTMLGGFDENGNKKIVEIDESVFFKRKYNRGRILNNQ